MVDVSHDPHRAAPRRLLPILFLGVLMAALDIAIVGPALPAIRDHFGVDERATAWVFNTFVLFNLLGLPFMARASDVFGRRVLYVADVALFALGSLVVALSPSFGVLLAGRALQGLGASGIFPAASAVVGDTFPPERRGRALGLLGAVFGVAFIVGPIIGGVLLLVGWPWLFVVNLPLAAFVGVAGWRHLPASRPAERHGLDGAGILTLALLLGALAFGIGRVDTSNVLQSIASPGVWPFLAVSIVLLPVFITIERRTRTPLVRLALFESRQVVLAAALAAGAGLTEAAFIFFSFFAVAAFGVTKSSASFMLLPLVFAVAVGSPVLGRLLDRVGSRAVIFSSTLLLTSGLVVMGTVSGTRAFFYVGSVLIGFGLSGLLGSALSYILLNESHASERTVAQGVITLFISVGQLVGAALIGAIVTSAGAGMEGYQTAFLAIGAVTTVLTLCSLLLKSREVEREDTLRRMREVG